MLAPSAGHGQEGPPAAPAKKSFWGKLIKSSSASAGSSASSSTALPTASSAPQKGQPTSAAANEVAGHPALRRLNMTALTTPLETEKASINKSSTDAKGSPTGETAQVPNPALHRLSELHESLEQADLPIYLSLKLLLEMKIGRPIQVSYKDMQHLKENVTQLQQAHKQFMAATNAFLIQAGMVATSPETTHEEADDTLTEAADSAPQLPVSDSNVAIHTSESPVKKEADLDSDGEGVIADGASAYTIMPGSLPDQERKHAGKRRISDPAAPMSVILQEVAHGAVVPAPALSAVMEDATVGDMANSLTALLRRPSSPAPPASPKPLNTASPAGSSDFINEPAFSQPLETMPTETTTVTHLEPVKRRRSVVSLNTGAVGGKERRPSQISLDKESVAGLSLEKKETAIEEVNEDESESQRIEGPDNNLFAKTASPPESKVPPTVPPPLPASAAVPSQEGATSPSRAGETIASPEPPAAAAPSTTVTDVMQTQMMSPFKNMVKEQIVNTAIGDFKIIVSHIETLDRVIRSIQIASPSENPVFENTESGHLRRFGCRDRIKDVVKGCGNGAGRFGGVWARGDPGELWMNDLMGLYIREMELTLDASMRPKPAGRSPPGTHGPQPSPGAGEAPFSPTSSSASTHQSTPMATSPHASGLHDDSWGVSDVSSTTTSIVPGMIFYDPSMRPPGPSSPNLSGTAPPFMSPPLMIPLDELFTWLQNTRHHLNTYPQPDLDIILEAVDRLGGYEHVKVFGLDWFRQFYRFQPNVPYPLPSCLNTFFWHEEWKVPSHARSAATLAALKNRTSEGNNAPIESATKSAKEIKSKTGMLRDNVMTKASPEIGGVNEAILRLYRIWWDKVHLAQTSPPPPVRIFTARQYVFIELLCVRELLASEFFGKLTRVSEGDQKGANCPADVLFEHFKRHVQSLHPAAFATIDAGRALAEPSRPDLGRVGKLAKPSALSPDASAMATARPFANDTERAANARRDPIFPHPSMRDSDKILLRERAILISAFFRPERFSILKQMEEDWITDGAQFVDVLGGPAFLHALVGTADGAVYSRIGPNGQYPANVRGMPSALTAGKLAHVYAGEGGENEGAQRRGQRKGGAMEILRRIFGRSRQEAEHRLPADSRPGTAGPSPMPHAQQTQYDQLLPTPAEGSNTKAPVLPAANVRPGSAINRDAASKSQVWRILPTVEVAKSTWEVAEAVVEYYLTMELPSKYQGV